MATAQEAEIGAKGRGEIYRVAGPVVTATGLQPRMYDVVFVGEDRLMGEVIKISGDRTVIQVYEDTSGVKPGEPVVDTGAPLLLELGPGLLGSIYDGIQRPLPVLQKVMGDFIRRGVRAPGIDRKKAWDFVPALKVGDAIAGGQIIGTVQEVANVEHRVLAPPDVAGTVASVESGKHTVDAPVVTLDNGTQIRMFHRWPVRRPRPTRERLMPTVPLITGQRVLDFLFPVAKGGTAAIPGGFGTGKCVVGTTPVFLADGRLVPIRQLYESVCAGRLEDGPEHLVHLREPLRILTFDGERIREGRASAVYRGSTDSLTEIRLRSGRAVRLTPGHRLFRFDGQSVVETPARDLKPGDSIVVPRNLPLAGSDPPLPLPPSARVADPEARSQIAARLKAEASDCTTMEVGTRYGLSKHTYWNYRLQRTAPRVALASRMGIPVRRIRVERASRSIRVPARMEPSVAEFLGLHFSEGMIKGGRVVEFYNNDVQLRARYRELLMSLFGLKGRERRDKTVTAVTVNSRALVRLIAEWGVPTRDKSRRIRLLPVLAAARPEAIRAFLRAYAEGDGHFADEVLEIATASRKMAAGLAYLFARIGVFARVSRKQHGELSYFRVWVSPKEASKLFAEYERNEYYDSYDVLPLDSPQVRQIRAAIERNRTQWSGVLKNAAAGERMARTAISGLRKDVARGSPIRGWLERLDTMLDHVLLDRVIDVRTWQEHTDVYDLTVDETHNFVGGELPMILHNTVTEQQLSKWSDAQIVVYIGCGERGNEMTEMLTLFPKLDDPKTGAPLMERTVIIANTSNMPVAAREASVYTGMTVAEYYRDMGYDVALMADSTSRWAEAMREISSRLEEMPGEEGFPAYLSARLSEFYERAGRAVTLNGKEGSVSVVGAVSPSGGDFSEPVTQGTMRIVKVFWGLDTSLRARRHFPAINWLTSYSLYSQLLEDWFRKNVHESWGELRGWTARTLQEEAELEEIVRLVGADALPEDQQLTLAVARMIREFFLQQNAYHAVDTYCPPARQFQLIAAIKKYADLGRKALALDLPLEEISRLKSVEMLSRVKYEEAFDAELEKTLNRMDEEFKRLEVR